MYSVEATMGVIYAMWLRQLKRYWRSRARMIGFLGQPILYLIALGFGFGPIFEQAGRGDYIQFLTPGIIAMSILFSGMFAGIEVIWDRRFGFLKETLVAPVSRTTIMIGRTLGGATVAVVQGIVVVLISLLFGFSPENFALFPLAIIFMFLIALFFTALGTVIATRLEDMQAFPIIMNFLIMPIFFLSGALFPLQDLPVILDIFTRFNPLSYGVDALRYTLTGVSDAGLLLDSLFLVVVTALMLVIGAYMFSKVEA